MTGKNKTSLLGWHPSSAEDAAWIREQAKREGRGALTRMLDEALASYRKDHREHPSTKGERAMSVTTTAVPASELRNGDLIYVGGTTCVLVAKL